MGGLAALYAHFRRPESSGAALAMSPSLWFAERKLFEFVSRQPTPWTSRLYVDAGVQEDGGSVVADAERLVKELGSRGYNEQSLCFLKDQEGTHSEHDWRKRAPTALQFLFSGTPGLQPSPAAEPARPPPPA